MTVFTCDNLTKSYRKKTVLDHVSLTLEKGRVYGLAGNAGAGKTTLLRLMMGIAFPDSGEMTLFGESDAKKQRLARKRIGSLVDTPIWVGRANPMQNLDVICQLRQVPDRKEAIMAAIKAVGLERNAHTPLRMLSIGGRAQLGAASALVGSPEFIVLDDPFAGMEPSEGRALRQALLDLQAGGATILISGRQLSQMDGLATDYIIMHNGRVLEQISEEELNRRCDGYYRLEIPEYKDQAAKFLRETFPDIRVEEVPEGLHIYSYYGEPQRIPALLERRDIPTKQMELVGLMRNRYLAQLFDENRVGTL